MYEYATAGVCAKDIKFEVENGIVKKVSFTGGCNGNLQGIASLVEGMEVDKLIEKLSGIKCGNKETSCPDQLSKALIKYKNK
ncbi:TIGR03905 family TSCPD domain-containing protein [Tissierella carlieri]|uniref:ribonucleoside-diphosphate reductase n=1 Tax=Tissierella carlieri TaxID=689904 RepID=A0ABT1SBF6_9FIRM|nr:TIGR03905 family TSCPD domain-containing protein [Tissierella carlieri]MCQ4923795.1 TIGR03905 family TSCPD domain-containing protein [Tissierella carlieri]